MNFYCSIWTHLKTPYLHNWVVTIWGEIWIRPEGIGTTITSEGYTCLRYVSCLGASAALDNFIKATREFILIHSSKFIKIIKSTKSTKSTMIIYDYSMTHIDDWFTKWCKKWCFKMSSFGKSSKSWIFSLPSGTWCHKCLLNSCLGEVESASSSNHVKIHWFRGKPWVFMSLPDLHISIYPGETFDLFSHLV